MELNDLELELVDNMLDELFDDMCHHPAEYHETETATYESLRKKVRDEARQRKLWWAR